MRNVVLGFFLLINCAIAFAQEAAKQPQTLITEKRTITATVKLPNGVEMRLIGEAFYQVKEMNSDDTFMGKFVFSLSDEARQLLAAETKQTIAEIPHAVESDNILAEFEKGTKCPELHLEIKTMTVRLANDMSVIFERIRFDLKETPQEVSTLMCRFVKSANTGRRYPYARIINRLLKGDATDQ